MQDQQHQLGIILLRPNKTPRGVLTGYEVRYATSNLEDGEEPFTGIQQGVHYQLNTHPMQMARELKTSKLYDINKKIAELEAERGMVEEAIGEFCKGQENKIVDIMQKNTYDVTKSSLITKEFKA
jgi:hypothetical protein